MSKVFIATTSFAKYDEKPVKLLEAKGLDISYNPHGRKLTADEIAGFISDADYLIAGTEPLTSNVLESAGRLKIISRCGVGIDNVDIDTATRLGIKVFNTPFGPTMAVAELTVGLIIDLLRKITLMNGELKSGIWKKQMGNLLNGKNVGIIGFGKIGREVAALLQGFDCYLRYYDIVNESSVESTLIAERVELNKLLSVSEIITIHISGSWNKPLIGRAECDIIKKGAWLINVSRGGVVDEGAIYDALNNGHLSGAALDVFEKEPYNGPLMNLSNVIMTPHVGSYAIEARIEMELQAVRNLIDGI
ncbi:NAD-binding D-isomer specific 2-hydroxyacid dehydrogenase [Candidatus Magnetobacterium bavaricum]|uniref:NAD-binding D-isomer specific 2-hydroxyacid dehydrogenase n=1 Tax=Candidatus Magnetobacterium bavaricum TaxID=29290 RepID=A0A0F3GJL9_9BACT|nr:NAD-binding D-isomer specific 2-hydroxyacid dehydrogenase [Candidatus Magnetobacterium bavaricum]